MSERRRALSRGRLAVTLILVALGAAGCAGGQERPSEGGSEFEIGLIGDFPYNAEQEAQAESIFDELNGEELAFVVHAGDIKGGSSPCDDETYRKELERFEGSENPFIYTPGDNDWLDCHRTGYDPNEQLQRVRETFFTGDESFGERTIELTRQSEDYPENARWNYGGVTFATLHIVGGNNGLNSNNDQDEYDARNEANLAWLEEIFETAQGNGDAGVMLFIQANIFEEDTEDPSGFADFKEALEQEVTSYDGPVVLVHGDTHYFRIDQPMKSSTTDRRIENFTRVETFGDPYTHWVRTTVDTRDAEVFSFQPEIVEENVASTL